MSCVSGCVGGRVNRRIDGEEKMAVKRPITICSPGIRQKKWTENAAFMMLTEDLSGHFTTLLVCKITI